MKMYDIVSEIKLLVLVSDKTLWQSAVLISRLSFGHLIPDIVILFSIG